MRHEIYRGHQLNEKNLNTNFCRVQHTHTAYTYVFTYHVHTYIDTF